MTDYYSLLSVDPGAKQEEVQAAFDELLATRRAKRQKTSDLHAAFAVIGEPAMRKSYDMVRLGTAASERLVHAKAVTIDFAKDAIPEIDIREVLSQAREVALKVTVLGSGVVARSAEVTANVSRAVQGAASRRLQRRAE